MGGRETNKKNERGRGCGKAGSFWSLFFNSVLYVVVSLSFYANPNIN
jgi:hypothetical protein